MARKSQVSKNSESKIAKLTLKFKVNDSHFQYQLRVSHDAWFMQIWWFQLKSVTGYRAEKVKFTDRQTDGQTHGNDNTPSAWKAKGEKHCSPLS